MLVLLLGVAISLWVWSPWPRCPTLESSRFKKIEEKPPKLNNTNKPTVLLNATNLMKPDNFTMLLGNTNTTRFGPYTDLIKTLPDDKLMIALDSNPGTYAYARRAIKLQSTELFGNVTIKLDIEHTPPAGTLELIGDDGTLIPLDEKDTNVSGGGVWKLCITDTEVTMWFHTRGQEEKGEPVYKQSRIKGELFRLFLETTPSADIDQDFFVINNILIIPESNSEKVERCGT